MRLIDEARHAWRMASMQAMAAAGALQLTWLQLPDELKASIPHEWITYATAALIVIGMLGRLVKQDLPKAKP